MNQFCVVVTNGSQARFFTLEDAEFPEYQSSPNLIEATQLYHPDHEPMSQSRLRQHSATETPLPRELSDNTVAEHDKKFAHTIAIEASRLSRSHNISDFVLVSQNRMLSHLRNAVQSHLKGVTTLEVAKDLSKLSPHELHNYLARENLLPERRLPQH